MIVHPELGEIEVDCQALFTEDESQALIVLTAVLTATATLIVGPISFVGLLAPHIARRAGLATPLAEIAGAMLAGATLLMLADLLARTIAFPWDAPAGLVVTVIGALGYAVLMGRR
ncbi:MAG: iron-hydroxamate transporter permease subunit [Starkeya sp.]|nr:iron-hydroxamate transporter permease subunit [Starkeya sp.]